MRKYSVTVTRYFEASTPVDAVHMFCSVVRHLERELNIRQSESAQPLKQVPEFQVRILGSAKPLTGDFQQKLAEAWSKM